jgi:hypothetical protein
MTTDMREKATMAGAKRKAEISKETSKGSKKPKIDSVQNLKPHVESKRSEKPDVVARHLISGALGVPVSKKTEKLTVDPTNMKKDMKAPKAQASKVKSPIVKKVAAAARADSSDDDFEDFEEDGGVALDDVEGSDDAEESLHTAHQGVHPDRVKANSNGARPNSTI